MDDLYAINKAKTEFREGLNRAEPFRILAIADSELIIFSDGQPSGRGLDSLQRRLATLFEAYTAHLTVIMMEIRIRSDVAHDYGWHELTLTPKQGGDPIQRRYRYVDIWRKNQQGEWKLWTYIDNLDVPDSFKPETVGSAQTNS